LKAFVSHPQRQSNPAAERNQGPILTELRRLLPAQGLALEIASGSGQHAAFFATNLPLWRWQPSDRDIRSLASINAWGEGLPNLLPALQLDVADSHWQGVAPAVDAIFCANMLHISPWTSCAALMQGVSRHLSASGLLVLYGPYLEDGQPAAPSNLAFDADLRMRDATWGLRRLSEVLEQAKLAGLLLRERVAMPANNLLLVLARA
jgi:hypothetical protein